MAQKTNKKPCEVQIEKQYSLNKPRNSWKPRSKGELENIRKSIYACVIYSTTAFILRPGAALCLFARTE